MTEPKTQGERLARPTSRRLFLQSGGLAASGLALLGAARVRSDDAPAAPACDIPDPPDGKEKPAAPYTFPVSAPVRRRKSFADLLPGELADLVKAYGALKKNAGNLSWCSQANIHANHCVAASYYLLVHDSWLFLPWHHCYLYFYESLLGEALGNPSFALPYWDWSANPTIPDAFFDATSSLYDNNRGRIKGESISVDSDTYTYTRQTYVDNLVNNYPDFFSFGGYPGDQTTNQPGDLELYPHNLVHTWVGKQTTPFIDMGNLAYAARDLLFFLHHANIDRIWTKWAAVSGHQNPADTAWLRQWFNFFDPKTGNPVSVTVADTVNGNMNVLYQEPQSVLALKTGEQDLTGRTFTSSKLSLTGTAVARLLRPTLMATSTASPIPAARVRLRIEGVRSPRQLPVRIRVFLNKPDANVDTPLTDSHFAGSIPLVPSFIVGAKHAAHAHPPVLLSLDVSGKLAELIRQDPAAANVEVTLVPVGLDKKLGKAKVTFKGISLNVLH